MKFGGAAVATPRHFSRIAQIVSLRSKEYDNVVVVVSAMGKTTDQLISLAHEVSATPPRRELDMLVSVGERVSISLLAMALSNIKLNAISFTGSQSGIITCVRHADARIVEVKPYRILSCLSEGKIVIVAGFQGVSCEKEITTLGRGGSDTTAVALAVSLGAEKVEFYKDVSGVFAEDPKRNPNTTLHKSLTYKEAMDIANNGAQILHARCILLAQKNGMPLHVRSFNAPEDCAGGGTIIGDPLIERKSKNIYEEIDEILQPKEKFFCI